MAKEHMLNRLLIDLILYEYACFVHTIHENINQDRKCIKIINATIITTAMHSL
jgi:hypothetical protein